MKVQQISLNERIRRIKTGYASDPEFIISAIKSLANIKVIVFLNEFADEMMSLRKILDIAESEVKEITYKEVAERIYKIRLIPHRKLEADEAVWILSLPLRKCYEERKSVYEKSEKNTT